MSAELAALFQLPPEQAARYLEAKGYALTWDWWEMVRGAHAHAFTVAKVARLDILQDIRSAVETALQEGRTEPWFRAELEEVLRKKGWWGQQLDADGRPYQAGSPRRLQTIYRTNLQSAYMAGRQRQFDLERDRAPYVQYLAVRDSSTRPAHAALHGKVFRLDDPAWDVVAPPNGFNCRCRARNLSQRELDARGLKVEGDARIEARQASDAPPGLDLRRGVSVPDPEGGRRTLWVDAGWDANPGRSAPWADIELWSRARATLSAERAAEALHEHALHPARLAAFDAWVDAVLQQDGARGLEWVIGYMSAPEVAALLKRGGAVANGSIVLADRLLVGPKARRHESAGNALTADEWKQAPRLLAEPEAVLYDRVNGALLYVLPSQDGRKTKIVVEGGRVERKRAAYESVRSAFKVDINNLKQGQFELLRGRLS